jgi:uncharacterized protein
LEPKVRYNVAQLLLEPIGSTRIKCIEDDSTLSMEDVELVTPITGQVRLMRIQSGILVQGRVEAEVEIQCGRCLAEFVLPLEAAVEEEFRAGGRFAGVSGEDAEDEDPALVISEEHELDLREVVRQQLLLALPTHPLCRVSCAGLCSHCGQDLNEGPCECTAEPDPRWGALLEMQLAGELEEGEE